MIATSEESIAEGVNTEATRQRRFYNPTGAADVQRRNSDHPEIAKGTHTGAVRHPYRFAPSEYTRSVFLLDVDDLVCDLLVGHVFLPAVVIRGRLRKG